MGTLSHRNGHEMTSCRNRHAFVAAPSIQDPIGKLENRDGSMTKNCISGPVRKRFPKSKTLISFTSDCAYENRESYGNTVLWLNQFFPRGNRKSTIKRKVNFPYRIIFAHLHLGWVCGCTAPCGGLDFLFRVQYFPELEFQKWRVSPEIQNRRMIKILIVRSHGHWTTVKGIAAI